MSRFISTGSSAEQIAISKLTLKEALGNLTPMQLIVLQLRMNCDLSQAAIAERLHITQGRVSVLEKKALETLRSFLLDE